ncbi:hypothetical protein J2853_001613 [Streptosporangium lutulentum]|uniref:Uncharacterized protein n=1 Tax=Streptosporangium lutulentum TaxID=1461250 RepID=A0ABT9Q6M3_9ACTN|nr:hypothetical protein [Streptosporangium lutulentum]
MGAFRPVGAVMVELDRGTLQQTSGVNGFPAFVPAERDTHDEPVTRGGASPAVTATGVSCFPTRPASARPDPRGAAAPLPVGALPPAGDG